MNTELEQNLPLSTTRKPIYYTPKIVNHDSSAHPSNTQLSISTGKSDEEEDSEVVNRIQVKRIRYLNPMKYYVTQDVINLIKIVFLSSNFGQGYTFPTNSQESLGPIHLINLSNKVQQISIDPLTGDMSYCLTPRFDSADVIPW